MWHTDRTYYDILQISLTASLYDIKEAFFNLARRNLPKNEHNECDRLFLLVREAYEVLSISATREQYDRWLLCWLDGKYQADR
jgi:curved DNA-binding protein CbpA